MDVRGQVSADGSWFLIHLKERACKAADLIDPTKKSDAADLLSCPQSQALMGFYAARERRTAIIEIPLASNVYPKAVQRHVRGLKYPDIVVQVTWVLTERAEEGENETEPVESVY
ncbi:Uncharacterized protein PBTT_09633 [Plasmodiophora brassicae]